MLNHMTMPVLFAIVIGVMALVTIAVFLTVRILGERSRTGGDVAKPLRRGH